MATSRSNPLSTGAYTIAWITALWIELRAAKSVLDHHHPPPHDLKSGEDHSYSFGSIHGHNIVIACLPAGGYGTTNAAVAAGHIRSSFPSIQFYLLVGVGGGIPTVHDVRLGDIVVSRPEGTYNGVVQHDFGKVTQYGEFLPSGNLNKPPQALLKAIASLQASAAQKIGDIIHKHLEEAYSKDLSLTEENRYQGVENDVLYKAGYGHRGGTSDCKDGCSDSEVVVRKARSSATPVVHYGTIASGNQVVKDGETRDKISQSFKALCFEMEAAGLMDNFPTLVVRGICDYSDSHKNKRWQPYAALVAAAYTKELLKHVAAYTEKLLEHVAAAYTPHHISSRLNPSERIFDIPGTLHPNFSGRQKYLKQIHTAFSISPPQQRNIVSVFGIPGLGKSQICLKYIADHGHEYDYAFHATASTEKQWLNSCDSIVGKLGLPEGSSEDQSKRIQALRTWLAGKSRWFLIVDDVTEGAVASVRDTLPSSFGGHVLLSTRDKFIAWEFGENRVALQEMDPDEGRELVLKIYGQSKGDVGGDAQLFADKINQKLGGLPLALEQGTTCARRRCWGLGEYLENLGENMPSIIRDETQTNTHHKDIITTLSIALMGLEAQHVVIFNIILMMRPQALPMGILVEGGSGLKKLPLKVEGSSPKKHWARRLVTRLGGRRPHRGPSPGQATTAQAASLSNKAGSRITEAPQTDADTFKSAQAILQSKPELEKAIVRMEQSSLIRRGEGGEIWVHDLIREILLDGLEERERRDFLSCAVQIVRRAFPRANRFEENRKRRLYLPHMMEVCDLMKSNVMVNHDRAYAVYSIAVHLSNDGGLDQAILLFEELREYHRKADGDNSVNAINALTGVAVCHRNKGEFGQSMVLLQQAVDDIEKLEKRGEVVSRRWKLVIFDELAFIYRILEKYEEAETEYSKIISELEEMEPLKMRDKQLSRSLRGAGIAYERQGNLERALELYERALEGYKRLDGDDSHNTLGVIQNMADVFRKQKQLEKAMEYAQQAWKGFQKIYGDNHMGTTYSIEIMAYIYRDKGECDLALKHFQQILPLFEGNFGKDHRDTKVIIDNIQKLRLELGQAMPSSSPS
ncbi:hypothetical protein TWF730_006461 [Orbilia blumenaviensis]|uniref:Nucleoside phosphorylase domain-containing protein n=1 Tax=Orbilia blumenaviensis TaxID=1796055 RepID=A0AAV9VGZ0_9PEZI